MGEPHDPLDHWVFRGYVFLDGVFDLPSQVFGRIDELNPYTEQKRMLLLVAVIIDNPSV